MQQFRVTVLVAPLSSNVHRKGDVVSRTAVFSPELGSGEAQMHQRLALETAVDSYRSQGSARALHLMFVTSAACLFFSLCFQ